MDKKEEYEKQKEKIFVNAKKVIEISKKYEKKPEELSDKEDKER